MKTKLILLSVAVIIVILVIFVPRKAKTVVFPVKVTESVNKADSIQKRADILRTQLESTEKTLSDLYAENDRLKKSVKTKVIREQAPPDTIIKDYREKLDTCMHYINNLEFTVDSQKVVIFKQDEVINIKDSAYNTLKRHISEIKLDYDALNYYRKYRARHHFISFLFGLESK